jgi:hypothetical protein
VEYSAVVPGGVGPLRVPGQQVGDDPLDVFSWSESALGDAEGDGGNVEHGEVFVAAF